MSGSKKIVDHRRSSPSAAGELSGENPFGDGDNGRVGGRKPWYGGNGRVAARKPVAETDFHIPDCTTNRRRVYHFFRAFASFSQCRRSVSALISRPQYSKRCRAEIAKE